MALGAVVALIGEGLILPVGLVSAAFLSRNLGVDEYGLLGLLFAAVAPVAWIAATAIGGRAAVTLISAADDPMQTAAAVIRLNLWIGIGACMAFALAAPWVATLLGRPNATSLLVLAGLEILLFPVAKAHRDALVALGRYSSAGLAAAIQNIFRLALLLAAVTAGLRVEGVILAAIVARIAEIVWCRSVVAPPLLKVGSIRRRGLANLLSASFLYALCIQLFNRIDILLLSAWGESTRSVGEFSAAQALAMAPGLFAMVLSGLMISAMISAEAAGATEEPERVRRHCDQIAAVGAGLTLALSGASVSLSEVLFGAAFAGSAPLLMLLLIGGAGAIVLSFATAQHFVAKRFTTLLLIGGSMLGAAIVGHLLAIPLWGAQGAAAVTAATAVLGGLSARLALPGPRAARFVGLAAALGCGAFGFALARLLAEAAPPLVDAAAGAVVAAALMIAARVVRVADLWAFVSDLKPSAPP